MKNKNKHTVYYLSLNFSMSYKFFRKLISNVKPNKPSTLFRSKMNSYLCIIVILVNIIYQSRAAIAGNNVLKEIRKKFFCFEYMRVFSKDLLSNLADYLKVCHQSDPKLNECIQSSIELLRPKLADGVQELLIPPCEPLQIPKITIKQNAGAISMESEYSSILVHGLSNFTIHGVK